jgi:hypothetical protein
MRKHAKDRHDAQAREGSSRCARAVKAGVQVIATANLKDFASLADSIEAQSLDDLLCYLFDLDPHGFVEMLREQAGDLRKPRVMFEQLPARLAKAAPELMRSANEHLAPRSPDAHAAATQSSRNDGAARPAATHLSRNYRAGGTGRLISVEITLRASTR